MGIKAIAIKDLKQTFYHPTAYVLSFFFLIITGWFFSSTLFLIGQAELRDFVGVVPFLLMFFIPAITMRTISEERKQGTIELILTNPVTDTALIFGKFTASFITILFFVFFTLTYPIILTFIGNPDIGHIISSYVGIILLSSFYIAIGIFASSITFNQIVAFILSFSIIFFFYILQRVAIFMPPSYQEFLLYLSSATHFKKFTMGLITLQDVVYYLTGAALFLHIANDIIESRLSK
ncbi:ABC transporter, permease [Deferribacter desulfuricans SSM1]|uniref:ABC transporter, permease n=1 Tax=Deferribacter desulfuricans (strain DSM 14783 / JCM 11476 / NBRC 101012 / SSM1) TaxID=639282 RepID=D3PEH8_DEFDS|nr:ABC transporter permease subunit [Deferribacter desulfuricans]BAI81001.1 ABC transporter, permease [Deferribacter desulfuricans SSM1]